jgi:hypothetical protein
LSTGSSNCSHQSVSTSDIDRTCASPASIHSLSTGAGGRRYSGPTIMLLRQYWLHSVQPDMASAHAATIRQIA